MRKVIVFTNPDKIIDVHPDFASALEGHMPTEQNPVFHLLEDGDIIWETVNDFSSGGVYLVNDSPSDNLFDKLLDQICGDESYALVHSLPKRKTELKGCTCREGMHEPGNIYYSHIFEVLTDNDSNKEDRVVDILRPSRKEKLSKAANAFLIGCLAGERNIINEAYDTLKNCRDIEDEIVYYYESGCPNGEDWCKIRDYLLGWIKTI